MLVSPNPPSPPVLNAALAEQVASQLDKVLYEVKRVVVGQDSFLEKVLVALLAQGHLLVEGMPGLAKTLTVKTLAQVLGSQFGRIQFTPDLMPADLIGTRLYHPQTGEFSTALGPVFTNLLLADEINRAPAKVQSALLEVMQERQVTLAGKTHPLPAPFVVMATQNPLETEGTYPLPEAQTDRFMMKVLIHLPSEADEFVVVERSLAPPPDVRTVLSLENLQEMQQLVQQVYVDPGLIQHAVHLVNATRPLPAEAGEEDGNHDLLIHGASPRASIALVQGARALALLRGRPHVRMEDLHALAYDVLRHRVTLSYQAMAKGMSTDEVLFSLLERLMVIARPATLVKQTDTPAAA